MDKQKQQPIFNSVPLIILMMIGVIGLTSFAGFFVPNVKSALLLNPTQLIFEELYRLVTYGFIHVDYTHLGFNMLWLTIFATPIVRYFGNLSFFIIFIAGLITGGLIFITDNDSYLTLIGASAGVSSCVGAALRFMLKPAFDFYQRPLLYKLSDGRFLLPSVIFCVIDIGQALFMAQIGENIAWQSHLIGFVTGALLMELSFINHKTLKRNKLTSSEEHYLGD